MVEHWNAESEGEMFDSSWGPKNLFLSHARDKTINIFLYFSSSKLTISLILFTNSINNNVLSYCFLIPPWTVNELKYYFLTRKACIIFVSRLRFLAHITDLYFLATVSKCRENNRCSAQWIFLVRISRMADEFTFSQSATPQLISA